MPWPATLAPALLPTTISSTPKPSAAHRHQHLLRRQHQLLRRLLQRRRLPRQRRHLHRQRDLHRLRALALARRRAQGPRSNPIAAPYYMAPASTRRPEPPIQVPQTQSAFHPHAQRNASRRRDARQRSRSFAPYNPQLKRSPNSNRLCRDCRQLFPSISRGGLCRFCSPTRTSTRASSRSGEVLLFGQATAM